MSRRKPGHTTSGQRQQKISLSLSVQPHQGPLHAQPVLSLHCIELGLGVFLKAFRKKRKRK